MKRGLAIWLGAAALAVAALPAGAADTPKYGGTLTYMIPADSPPSFDAQREQTYATIHSAAPFYSTLVRVNPYDPSSTTDIVCDVCTEIPKPTDGGKTWTFKIRDDVKFHNGDKLTADDVAASFNKIAFPPEGVLSPRSSNFMMVDKIEATDPHTVVFHLNSRPRPSCRRSPTPTTGSTRRRCSTRTSTGTSTTFSAPARSSSPASRAASGSRGCATPTTTTRGCPISTALSASMRPSRRPSSMRSAATAPPPSSAATRLRRSPSSRTSSATR